MADSSAIIPLGKSKDLSGIRFGRWTARRAVGRLNGRDAFWECVCDCGGVKEINRRSLIRGESRSCGCLRRDKTKQRFAKIGGDSTSYPAEYSAYRNAVDRCQNSRNKSFRRYGQRGISVCDRWINGAEGLSGFQCFLADMGPRPSGLTLDRIDNSGPYSPQNCRWADRVTQANNRG